MTYPIKKMSKGKKILLGVIVVIGGFFAFVTGTNLTMTDEQREELKTEREERERQEMFERIAQKEKEAELAKQEELEKEFYEKNKELMDLGIDPREFEEMTLELKGDYRTLDELQQLKWGGKISQNEFCSGMLTLMNQDRDRYLSEYWIDSFYRDCGTYEP